MILRTLSDRELLRYFSYRSIIRPAFIRKGLLIIWCLVILVSVLFLFVPFTQTIRGEGRLMAFSPDERVQSVDAPIYGRLGKWFVEEGSFVEKGDPIVEIFDTDPQYLERLKDQRAAIKKKLDFISSAAETSKLNLDRQKKLLDEGIVSQRDYEKARLEYNKYVVEEAKASEKLSKIDVKISRQSTQMLSAPLSGFIQRRLFGVESQLVKTGDQIAVLVPQTSSRSVELWVSDADVPFIKNGDRVRLQFDGWPAIQSFGWPSLALGTFGGKVSFIDQFASQNGKSRLLIVPDESDTAWPDSKILRQGVRTYGWVLLREVSFGFELWRKFNGFPPFLLDEIQEEGGLKSDAGKSSMKDGVKSSGDKK